MTSQSFVLDLWSPDLEHFLTQYLKKVNKEVDQHNAVVDRQEFHDLFETSCSMAPDLCWARDLTRKLTSTKY